jgi:hypothetical protein
MTIHYEDIRNRSNFTMVVSFDHVYYLPCNGMSIRANSSTKFLNSLSLGHVHPLIFSCGLNIRLKYLHIIHGSLLTGFSPLIYYRNSSLPVPLDGPYTSVILINVLSVLNLRSAEIKLTMALLFSHMNIFFLHVRITPLIVPCASKHTSLSHRLPKIYLIIISNNTDNFISCR